MERCRKEEVATVTRSEMIVSNSEIYTQPKAKENALSLKPFVTEKDVLDFLKLLRRSKYKVMEQLNKMSAQISILNLLLTYELHREALLRILSEATKEYSN